MTFGVFASKVSYIAFRTRTDILRPATASRSPSPSPNSTCSSFDRTHTDAPFRFSSGRPFQLSPPWAFRSRDRMEAPDLTARIRVQAHDVVTARRATVCRGHHLALRHRVPPCYEEAHASRSWPSGSGGCGLRPRPAGR